MKNTKDEFLKFALKIAEQAGKKILKGFREKISSERKALKEIGSVYDKISDNFIIGEIKKNYPEHSYLTEESDPFNNGSDYLWIIDPLDGTSNFVNGNPFWAVSVALWMKGEPYLGVIEAPVLQERFVALRGQGAWVEDSLGKRKYSAKVSEVNSLSQAYMLYCPGGAMERNDTYALLEKYYRQVKDMRKLGSAALELAWVGTGRADVYLTPQIHLWDIAAGVLFVKESGGEVADFEGKIWDFGKMMKADKINLRAFNNHLSLWRK